MGKVTLSELSAKLAPIIRNLDEHAVDEDTMIGFNAGFEPVIGDIGTEPLIAWLRWDASVAERHFDLQTLPRKASVE